MKQVDFHDIDARERYKLMTGAIVPRPIAWVTTQSRTGARNAAPFSFFNIMSASPPLVALGIMANSRGGMKDTARNILETKAFVVNLVPFSAAAEMSSTSAEFPADIDELDRAGIETVASVLVAPPRISACPIAFECRYHSHLEVSRNQFVILGEIVMAHMADHVLEESDRNVVDTSRLDLVGRMHGRGWYTTTRDLFQIERPQPPHVPDNDAST